MTSAHQPSHASLLSKMTSLEKRAREFAMQHHSAVGHVRQRTGEPYTNHLSAVVSNLRGVPHTPVMLAAAWLHDTLGNTRATHREILAEFGSPVADLVMMLTDVSRPSDGKRAARKVIDRAHIARAIPEAKTIRLADLIDNAAFIAGSDPGFHDLFLAEMSALLKVLREGDPSLWNAARNFIPHKIYSRYSK